jgi:hypothetical protein
MDLSVWYREGGAKAGGKRNPPMEGGLIDRITDLRVQTIIINHCPLSRDAVHRLNKDQPFKWQKLTEYLLHPSLLKVLLGELTGWPTIISPCPGYALIDLHALAGLRTLPRCQNRCISIPEIKLDTATILIFYAIVQLIPDQHNKY